MEKLHFWHLQHWHEKTMEILSLCKKTPTLSISDRWTVTLHFCHAFLPACVYISSKNNFPFVMLLSGSLLFRLLSTWRCPHRPRRPNKLWPNTGTPCRALYRQELERISWWVTELCFCWLCLLLCCLLMTLFLCLFRYWFVHYHVVSPVAAAILVAVLWTNHLCSVRWQTTNKSPESPPTPIIISLDHW